jgi:aspartate beta-hydroxylase
MSIDRATAEAIARTGVAALQAGDGAGAKAAFTQLVDGGHATAAMQLMLARACKLSGDIEREGAALDAILAGDPRNLRALLMRGDCYRRSGDSRAAVSFFHSALGIASALPSVPPELQDELAAAQAFVESSSKAFVDTIEQALQDSGAAGDTRMRHAVDIVAGKREIFLQQPSVLYVPYLPQRQFYEREEFEWVPQLEAATAAIREELVALLQADANFEPYVVPEDNRPHRDFHHLLNDPSWSAFYLWKDGERVEENIERCPRTAEAMEKVPLSRIGSRTPSVLFSMLQPGGTTSGRWQMRRLLSIP